MEEKKFISIKWHTDDVLETAKQMHRTLTIKQANDVLDYIEHHHDADLGVSWITIKCAIESKVYYDEEINL